MNDYYVYKRSLDGEQDIANAFEGFGRTMHLTENDMLVELSDAPTEVREMFDNPDQAFIRVHNSWGDGLHACTKVKAYVHAHKRFNDNKAQFDWEDEMAELIEKWLAGCVAIEPSQ